VPGENQAVIRIRASGLCGSDLQCYRATLPPTTIMGHEPCGTVAALGREVTGFEIGDRVMIHHCEGCDVCEYCRQGYYQLCVDETRTYGGGSDGAHADYLLARASTLVPLPDELSFEEGAALSCGTGTAYFALRRMQLTDGETLAVYGQGPVGLSATLLAKYMGASVISPRRLQLAQGLGADVIVNPEADDPIRTVHEVTGGRGADASIDCTGVEIARQQAVRSVRVFGRSCLVGEGGTVTFDATADIIHRHLALYGSWTFPVQGLADSSRFVVDHRVPLHRLITHRFPLERAEQAYQEFDAGHTGKCVLMSDDGVCADPG
jgi:threonine dehydrogenase-like Zn-dependent dehydrogenase